MRRHSVTCIGLVLLAGALVACSQDTPTVATSTAATGTTASASASPAASASASESSARPVLGPIGYGKLTLGMTKAEALATGLTTGTTVAGTGACGGPGDGFLAGSPPAASDASVVGRLFFSATTGKLVAIYAMPAVKTPQGIGLDSTYAEVHAAYPTWQGIGPDSTNGRGGVEVPGNSHAHFRVVIHNHKVIELSLDSEGQDCYE